MATMKISTSIEIPRNVKSFQLQLGDKTVQLTNLEQVKMESDSPLTLLE
jgi:hypothetical protein